MLTQVFTLNIFFNKSSKRKNSQVLTLKQNARHDGNLFQAFLDVTDVRMNGKTKIGFPRREKVSYVKHS